MCDLLHRSWILLVDVPDVRLGGRELTHFHEGARVERLKFALLREWFHDLRSSGEVGALQQSVAIAQRGRRVLLVQLVGAALEFECLVAFALRCGCEKAVGSRL